MARFHAEVPVDGLTSSIAVSTFLTRDGVEIHFSADSWPVEHGLSVSWPPLRSVAPELVLPTKLFAQVLLNWHSPKYAINQVNHLTSCLRVAKRALIDPMTRSEHDPFVKLRTELRTKYVEGTVVNYLDTYRRWYQQCAALELDGFDEEYATYLSGFTIGGNVKGEAVLSNDPYEGPLSYRDLTLIQNALERNVQAHRSGDPDEVTENVNLQVCSLESLLITWLSLHFGVYPKALKYLNEEDLMRTVLDDGSVRYELRIPRLKKRGVAPREQFRNRPIEPRIGELLEKLIGLNRARCMQIMVGINLQEFQRPLFANIERDCVQKRGPFKEHAMRWQQEDFSNALTSFVISQRITYEDGMLLGVNSRRYRYTFATRLVNEGVSAFELADALDHTDIQHVMVYFNARSESVPPLDRATAEAFGKIADIFLGRIVRDRSEARLPGGMPCTIRIYDEATNTLNDVASCGTLEGCGKNVPKACYTCPKFRPWLDAPHELAIRWFFDERASFAKSSNSEAVAAMDLTITAAVQVNQRCKDILATQDRLTAYIDRARISNPFGPVEWDAPHWAMFRDGPPLSGQTHNTISFSAELPSKKKKSEHVAFSPLFAELTRALMCEAKVHAGFELSASECNELVRALGYLHAVMPEGLRHPVDLSSKRFVDARALAMKREPPADAARIEQRLLAVAETMNRERLTRDLLALNRQLRSAVPDAALARL
jgi:hypothetical protein